MNEIQVAYFFKKLCPKRFDYLDYMYIFIHKYVCHMSIYLRSVFIYYVIVFSGRYNRKCLYIEFRKVWICFSVIIELFKLENLVLKCDKFENVFTYNFRRSKAQINICVFVDQMKSTAFCGNKRRHRFPYIHICTYWNWCLEWALTSKNIYTI